MCAVSYLNTTPLVWGMLHGAQQGLFDLTFRVPSECADMVASGEPWQLVTTMNEWQEGTSVEDCDCWHDSVTGQSQYLNTLHNG